VGDEHGANIITAIVTIFGVGNFRRTLENLIDIAIIYYITEIKPPEIAIFRNTAVTSIRKYQTNVIQVSTIWQWE
jgi:hypothetical protein